MVAWFYWNGEVWRKDERNMVGINVKKYRDGISSSIIDDDKEKKRIEGTHVIMAIMGSMKLDERIATCADDWDFDDWSLGGIVDLKSGSVVEAKRSSMCTKRIGGVVADDEDCPRWIKFLDEACNGDEEMIGFLKRSVGYWLTGSIRDQKFWFIYGDGGTGKSTFLNTVAGILGDYCTKGTAETFVESIVEQHPTAIAGMCGSRLVLVPELGEGRRWASGLIKKLTGEPTVEARFMRGDFFTYKRKFKMVFSGNNKPSIDAMDSGMRRRMLLVPFSVRVPENKQDSELENKLMSECSGILRWAINGCLEWQQFGLIVPNVVSDATREYFEEEDSVGVWLGDCCDVGPYQDNMGSLYESWVKWCERNGVKAGSKNRLGRDLTSKGIRKARANATRLRDGVRVRPVTWA